MNHEQNGRVVLITGPTGGLGAAVVRAFADEGARLVLTSRKQPDLEALASELELDTARTAIIPADATSAADIAQLVQSAQERFGAIDVVVHVTGGFRGGTSVPKTELETWELMLNLNLSSAFLLARAVLPGMLERGSGKLVFISSRGGSRPEPNLSAYGVSKSGVEMLVRILAEETRKRGINVNAVAPSVIDTPANRKAMPNADYTTWVQPESLASVIQFLASDAARDVHGAVIPVYGRA